MSITNADVISIDINNQTILIIQSKQYISCNIEQALGWQWNTNLGLVGWQWIPINGAIHSFFTFKQIQYMAEKLHKTIPAILHAYIYPVTTTRHDEENTIMTTKLITTNEPLTMSSREIAELLETRHADVCTSIERLMKKQVISEYTATPYTHPQNKQQYEEYHINKRDSYVVVAQLSPEFTARLVDRWQELENGATPAIPQTYSAALLEAAKFAEQAEKLALEMKQIENQVAEDKPYTKLGKIMTMVEGTIKIGEYAIMLQNEHNLKIGQNRIFEWLREHGYLCKDEHQKNRPTQRAMELGLFAYTQRIITNNHGEESLKFTPRLTGKGQAYFLEKLVNDFRKD